MNLIVDNYDFDNCDSSDLEEENLENEVNNDKDKIEANTKGNVAIDDDKKESNMFVFTKDTAKDEVICLYTYVNINILRIMRNAYKKLSIGKDIEFCKQYQNLKQLKFTLCMKFFSFYYFVVEYIVEYLIIIILNFRLLN